MHLAQHGWDRDSASAININNYHLTWLKSHPPKIWSYWRCFIVLFTRLYQMIKNPFDTPGKSPNLVCSPSRCFTAQKRHAELQICTRRAGPQSPTQLVQPPWKIWVCEEKEGTPKWLFDTICCENMWKYVKAYPWLQSFCPISKPIFPYFVIGNSWNHHPMDWISDDLRLESPISFLSTAGCPEISSTAATHSISACLAPYDWSWSPAESICWLPLILPKMWCGCNGSELSSGCSFLMIS